MFLGILLLFLGSSYSSLYVDLFADLGTKKDVSSSYRIDVGMLSWDLFLSSPLFGAGWDQVRFISGLPSHSIFLQLLGELGITGVVIELAIFHSVIQRVKAMSNKAGFKGNVWLIYLLLLFFYGHLLRILVLR